MVIFRAWATCDASRTHFLISLMPESCFILPRWLENLMDRNESQMTTLHATPDPFVGTLTTTNIASCTSRLHRNTKYGPNSSWILILWHSRACQGRWKMISSPKVNLKKTFTRRKQDPAHAQKRVTVPLKTNVSEKRESKGEGSVVDKAYCASGDSPVFSLTIN